ncbi:MAG TPA: protease HtpX [Chlamydiales bacterium]|nr:protease HtpX [Chlamydiales bacterium]
MFKRMFLFVLLNALVVLSVMTILNLLHVQPYLSAYGLNLQSLMIFCLVWGFAGSFISLFLSKPMAKWMMKVKTINPLTTNENEKNILFMVESLCRKAGLVDLPEIGIYSSNQINAFATGRSQKNSLIALSSSLIENLSEKEVEGVIAHEISHIANGDMVTMTLLQGVVNAFVLFLSRVLAFLIMNMSKERDRRPSYGNFYLTTYLFEIIFMLFGQLIVMGYSRKREYRADASAAQIAGKQAMLQALRALARIQNPSYKNQNKSIAAFQISGKSKKGFMHLFASHPTLEDRIYQLETNTLYY